MIFKFKLLFKELIFFGGALLVGLITARHYLIFSESKIVASDNYNFKIEDLIYFVLFLVIFYFLLIKFKKIAAFSLSLFLVLLVLSGGHITAGVIFDSPWDFGIAFLFAGVFVFLRNVLIHNIGMVVGLAGVGAALGLGISSWTGVLLLVVLSVYDILAVYWTRHMVYLAQGMIESGAIFGFIIPSTIKGLFVSGQKARQEIGSNFMILGSGDIGLPIIFTAAVAKESFEAAVFTAVFSMLGMALTHFIFVNQSIRRPMAALPPIATMTILGYLLSSLIF